MNGRLAARAAWGAMVAAVLVLTGCVAEPAPSPSPTTSTASPVPTSSATPTGSPGTGTGTPTPTSGAEPSWPAYDPADPSTWTIDFTGIGPFTVGPPLEEQVSAFDAFPRSEDCGNSGVASYEVPGTWLAAVAFGDGHVGLVSAAARAGEGQAARPHTPAGIRPGDTVAAVLAAYPGIQAHIAGSRPSYFVTDGTTWINFAVYGRDSVEAIRSDDTVDEISVGSLEFAPKEICG